MSIFSSAWETAKAANAWLRTTQFLDLVADNARLFVTNQKGLDRKYVRALIKKGKQEEEIARDLGKLLQRFKQWLQSETRSAATGAELRQEFQEFVEAFRKRQGGKAAVEGIVDPRGHVSATVKVPRPDPALGKVFGTDLKNKLNSEYKNLLAALKLDASVLAAAAKKAEETLADFLRIWESRRPAEKIEEIMSAFAKDHEKMRKQIVKKLEDAAKPGITEKAADKLRKEAAELREQIVERGRGRFASAREAVLKAALEDPNVRAQLQSVGLVVEESGSTISFVLDLGKPQLVKDIEGVQKIGAAQLASVPSELKIKLNIDHSKVDFADAIDAWIKTGDSAKLHPVIAGSNMRIATGLENQVFFNHLKKDAERWGPPLSKPTGPEAEAVWKTASSSPHPEWDTLIGELNVDKVVRDIEELLGHSLGRQERDAVRDYVEMAMSIK